MRIHKKMIAVVTAALLMAVSISAQTFAVGVSNTGSISINKTLTVKNPTLTSVDGPGASYAYAIAPETPSASNGGTTVSDGTHTSTVKAGPANGVTLSGTPISFPVGTAVTASASGAANTKSFTATADITKFSTPGVYRYKITETPTLGNAGVVDNGTRERILDVYVENSPQIKIKAEGSSLSIAGLVLHDANNNKLDSFDNALFETVNITLRNTIDGAMGDKNHEFPFVATISDNGRFYYVKENEAPSNSDTSTTSTSHNVSLSDNEVFYISGISPNATVAYVETNDTTDTYEVSYTSGTPSSVSPNRTKEMPTTHVQANMETVFSNVFDSTTPTNAVFIYGPYILIVLLGLAVFTLNKKIKVNK